MENLDTNHNEVVYMRKMADEHGDKFLFGCLVGQACGCMGPQDGEIYCNCKLSSIAAKMVLEERGYKLP